MVYKKICFLSIVSLIVSITASTFTAPIVPTAHNFVQNKPIYTITNTHELEKKTHSDIGIKDNTSFIFRIKYPETIKKQPNLRAYYKGYRYDIGNMGIISDQSEANTLFLIITDQIKHKSENERIQYLERIENNPCRAFFLSSKPSPTHPDTTEWQIVEENIQNVPLRLPEDAIIILLNAELVETLKDNPNKFVEDFKKNLEYDPKDSKRTIIYLPELIIKTDATQSQMDLAAAYASLCGIDLDAMHVSPKKEIKIERERIVELAPFGQRLL